MIGIGPSPAFVADPAPVAPAATTDGSTAPEADARPQGGLQRDPGESEKIDELKARDREVRAHERAHVNAGRPHTGQPQFEFEVGPDGRRYAVAGEVEIDSSKVRGDPEATIRKMEIVKRAALAPAEPSAQDRQVAAKADAIRREAERELARQKEAERRALQDGRDPDIAVREIRSIPLDGVIA